MKKLQLVTQSLWLIAGFLMILLLSVLIKASADVVVTIQDARNLTNQLTIDDVRHTLNIIEKQIDLDILKEQNHLPYR